MPKMYSSEGVERFYIDYQTEWMPRGMSIQAYCSRNNVPYRVLDRWIKDIYKKVVPVQVVGTPEELKIENHQHTETEPEKRTGNEDVSIKIIISTSSCMTKRKCSLHFGSEEGVEMSAVYHSIISTLKLCGKSVWNFFGDYFQCEVLGLDTYKEYLPALSR